MEIILVRLTAIEARLAQLEAKLVLQNNYRPNYNTNSIQDCSCPVNSVCLNVACPRGYRVT